MSSTQQQQQPFQGHERAEMEMNQEIQESNRGEMMEQSAFYQEFLLYLDSEDTERSLFTCFKTS